MKAKLIIFGVLIFVFSMLAFDAWIFSLAFGAERQADKTIILNFDDGPRPWALEKILPVLDAYHIKASFFLEGALVEPNKNIVREMHDKGHAIENHSWGHEIFPNLLKQKGKEAVKANLNKTANAIFEITGKYPKFFRPPCWVINKEVEDIITSLGYKVMKLGDPDIDTMDYSDFSKRRPTKALISRTKSQIAGREKRNIYSHVLVFHELTITAEALKTLIPYFQNQGYKFIRLDEKY